MTIHSQAQPWSLSRNHAEEIVKTGSGAEGPPSQANGGEASRQTKRSMWSEWGDSSWEALAKEDRLPPWHGEGSNEGAQSRKEVQATRRRVTSGRIRRYGPWSRCERWLALGIIHTAQAHDETAVLLPEEVLDCRLLPVVQMAISGNRGGEPKKDGGDDGSAPESAVTASYTIIGKRRASRRNQEWIG